VSANRFVTRVGGAAHGQFLAHPSVLGNDGFFAAFGGFESPFAERVDLSGCRPIHRPPLDLHAFVTQADGFFHRSVAGCRRAARLPGRRYPIDCWVREDTDGYGCQQHAPLPDADLPILKARRSR